MQMTPTIAPVAVAARQGRTENTTLRRMYPKLTDLLLELLTDERKCKSVFQTFKLMQEDLDLTYEGFRLRLVQGRIDLNDLPLLAEAMSVNGIDPSPMVATFSAACLPRDADLDGTMLDELTEMSMSLGHIARELKHNGNLLENYTKPELREVMQICGRMSAAARRLDQECLAVYDN